jgi:hypothetical protein
VCKFALQEEEMSVTIRIPPETHEQLRRLATERKEPIGRVVATAVERLEEDDFWDRVTSDYARLKADPEAYADYMAEHREWDVTLLDGLEADPWEEE